MSTRSKFLLTLLLIVAIAALAGIDAAMNKHELTAYLPGGEESSGEASSENASTVPPGAVQKQSGPDVAAVIAEQGFTTQKVDEQSLVRQVVGAKATVQDLSILKDSDRAGSVTWVDSPQVKTYFIALKESLLPAFSPEVTDLKDTTDAKPGSPVRNILTFFDLGLSEERMSFVRVRERLYEFHIAGGKEEVMTELIDALTSK